MMAAPNMATITASLERSFQNCSLNNHNQTAATTTTPQHHQDQHQDTTTSSTTTTTTSTTLELNSHISLPYHWEQCLDLKTGEIYYINWRNGTKAKEDPRTTTTATTTTTTTSDTSSSRDYYNYYTELEDDDDEEESSYDSEESSTEEVLVVGGCKSCFMYFMLPKHVRDCPKCCAQLLHFDRSQTASL